MKLHLGTLGITLNLDAKLFARDVRSAIGSIASIGKTAAVAGAALGGAMAAGIGASVRQFAMLEKELVDAAAVTREGMANFEAFQAASMKASAGSVFSAREAAQALKFMGKAGLSAEQSIGSLNTVLQAATASGEDLAFTSDMMTNAMTAFGLQAGDLTRVSDVLVKTTISSNTNMRMLGDNFRYVAPIAGAAGQSIEEISTVLGLMANASANTTVAGTSLRMMILRLQAPTKKGAKALKELGIQAIDANGKLKPITDVLLDLSRAQERLTDDSFSKALKEAFGTEAMTGIQAALRAGTEGIQNFRAELADAGGTAKRVAEIMQSSLSNQLRIIQGNTQNLAATIGQMFAPALRHINGQLTDMLKSIQDDDKAFAEMRDTVVAFLRTGADLVELLGVIAGLGIKISSVFTAAARGLALLYKSGQTFVAGLEVEKTLAWTEAGIAARQNYKKLREELERMAQGGSGFERMFKLGNQIQASSSTLADNMRKGAEETERMTRKQANLSVAVQKSMRAARPQVRRQRLNLGSTKKSKTKAVDTSAKKLIEQLRRERQRRDEQTERELQKMRLRHAKEYAKWQRTNRKRQAAEDKKTMERIVREQREMYQRLADHIGEGVRGMTDGLAGILGEGGLGSAIVSSIGSIFDKFGPKIMEALDKGKISDKDLKELAVGSLQQLNIAVLKTIIEHEKMQNHLSTIRQKLKEFGLGDMLGRFLATWEPAMGMLFKFADAMRPLTKLLGGGDGFTMLTRNFFMATKSFLLAVLSSAEFMLSSAAKILNVISLVANKLNDALSRVGITVLDGFASKMSRALGDVTEALGGVRDAHAELAATTLDDAQQEYNATLARAKDEVDELNSALSNVPSGFKRTLDMIRYQAQHRQRSASGAGVAGTGGTTAGGSGMHGDTITYVGNVGIGSIADLERMARGREFQRMGQTGTLASTRHGSLFRSVRG